MICPHCGKNLSDKLIARHLAGKGGRTTGETKSRDPKKMRKAALIRWKKNER